MSTHVSYPLGATSDVEINTQYPGAYLILKQFDASGLEVSRQILTIEETMNLISILRSVVQYPADTRGGDANGKPD